jgi:NTE family protein
MGAIVGGLYAMGLTYEELEQLFMAEDWANLFHDDPPRRQLPMRRKRTDREVPLGFEVGVGWGGLKLPPAVVIGATLTNALRANTHRARSAPTFDDLAIPFRAVATDVGTGSMVVLDRGNLAEAIRASMAVPGAFAAQEIDGRLLVDGGMVRNIPVDVIREMDVDIIIVSDVSTSLDQAPEARDALSLASRLVTAITWGTSQEYVASLASTDLHLIPDLGDIHASDFTNLERALAAGEAVARGAAPRLSDLSVDEDAYRALVEARSRVLPADDVVTPSEVVIITDDTRLNADVIRSALDVQAGDTLSLWALRERLLRVLGYGGFQSAAFRVVGNAGEEEVLEVHPRDKTWGPALVGAALTLEDRLHGVGGWSLRARIDWTRLTAQGGEAWLEMEMGTRHGVEAAFELPLTASEAVFLAASAGIGRRELVPVDIFAVPIDSELTDREAQVALGLSLGSWGEFTTGFFNDTATTEIYTELDGETPRDRLQDRAWFTAIEGDVLDRAAFPSSGHRLRVEYRRAGEVWGGSQAYEQLLAEGLAAASWGHQTLTFSGLLSTGLGTAVPLQRGLFLGGFDRMTGAGRDGMWGGHSGMAKLDWSYRLGSLAKDAAGGGLRFGASVAAGQAWTYPEDVDVTLANLRYGGTAWVGMETPLGPVRLGYAKLEGESPGWVLRVGVAY